MPTCFSWLVIAIITSKHMTFVPQSQYLRSQLRILFVEELVSISPRWPLKLPHLWPLKLLHLAGVN